MIYVYISTQEFNKNYMGTKQNFPVKFNYYSKFIN